MDNKKSYVYKITCKITGEFYFGSSFRAKSDQYLGSGRKIKERIAKYGKENFIKEILGEFDDRTIAHQVENHYIEKFRHDDKCLNQQLDHKFGTYGEESRARISAALCGEKNPMYGKIFSGEKNPMYGKHLTDETRTKISDALRGKQFSEDHIAKLSAAKLGKHWRKNPVTGKREWYD